MGHFIFHMMTFLTCIVAKCITNSINLYCVCIVLHCCIVALCCVLYSGFVRVLENLESPGILLWNFPGLEKSWKNATGPGKFWKSVKLN